MGSKTMVKGMTIDLFLNTSLKSPVNLTLAERQVWVTESQIRHRLSVILYHKVT